MTVSRYDISFVLLLKKEKNVYIKPYFIAPVRSNSFCHPFWRTVDTNAVLDSTDMRNDDLDRRTTENSQGQWEGTCFSHTPLKKYEITHGLGNDGAAE